MPIIGSFGAGAGSGFGQRQVSGPAFIEATGGDEVVTDGDYKIHIFTGDGTLCVTSIGKPSGSDTVDYMVVAGAGGGGQGTGGGGGAGGFRISSGTASGCYSVPAPLGGSAIPVTLGAMPINVGGGGDGGGVQIQFFQQSHQLEVAEVMLHPLAVDQEVQVVVLVD
jgi:hypothetical protein